MPARRWWIMAVVVLAAVVWIVSGVLTREPPAPERAAEREPMAVEVEQRMARPIERVLVLQGEVEPDQLVVVRAETAGQVAEWHVPRGARVEAEEEIARLRMDDREAQRQRAIAQLRRAESEFEAIRGLVERDFATPQERAAREAELEAARAELEAVEVDIANTRIRSPIDGVVDRRVSERGDFLSIGDPVAEIVDNDPLIAVVRVPQHQVHRVRSGQPARVRFLGGEEAEGEVTFVGALADPATRTFRMEVTLPNPDWALPAGISAEVTVPTDEVMAHAISPAHVTLGPDGRVGAMVVDDNDVARFFPVEAVRATTDAIWFTGLPEEVRLITVGQGFISPGERVAPRERDHPLGEAVLPWRGEAP